MTKEVPCETVHDAGLDWITVTTPGAGRHSQELWETWRMFRERARENEDKVKAQSWNGFHGEASSHVFCGSNDWGYMFRASSSHAREAALEIVRREIDCRPTRLDFQATVRTPGELLPYITRCEREARRHESKKRGVPARTVQTYRRPDSAIGFSIGAARSARCGVVYDKTREQHYRVESQLCRFEARFKQRQAVKMWETVKAAPDHDKLALATAASYFRSVGINRPWQDSAEPLKLPSTYSAPSFERTLDYLFSTTLGMVRRLREAGYGYELDEWWRCARWDELPDMPYDKMRRHFDDAT